MTTTGAPPSASRIFISYRRDNAAYAVGRLAYDLRQHFPADQVFQDIASIDPGLDFGEALQQGLDACAAVLVVIDPKWLTVSDRQGRRRLDVPEDWVRHEVAESLRRTKVRAFPVLLDTEMPGAEDLPEPLRPLTRRQAFRLTAHHWPHDVTQLIAYLKRVPGLSGAGAREAGEATARSPTEQEAQRVEAGERLANGEAQRVETAEEARRKSESEGRRTSEDVRRGAAKEAAPRGAQPPQARAHRWKVVAGIASIIGVAALAVFFGIERSPHAPLASATPPASSPPVAPAPAPNIGAPDSTSALPEKASAVAPRAKEFRDCDQCPQMVTVPSGRFMMGSPEGVGYDNEWPRHDVAFARSLAVGKYEVTFDEWDACVTAGGCKHRPEDSGWGRGKRPVIYVSWDDAQAYVAWLSKTTAHRYRLLSEAEWEYAARAGEAATVQEWRCEVIG